MAILKQFNFDKFVLAQCTMNPVADWGVPYGLSLYKFDSAVDTLIPYYIRTGEQAFGDPVERKRFKQIEFHSDGPSSGTIACRVWIDGRYVCDGIMTPTETPNRVRKINLPRGMNTGYTIDVEIAGTVPFRALEFGYEPMARTS